MILLFIGISNAHYLQFSNSNCGTFDAFNISVPLNTCFKADQEYFVASCFSGFNNSATNTSSLFCQGSCNYSIMFEIKNIVNQGIYMHTYNDTTCGSEVLTSDVFFDGLCYNCFFADFSTNDVRRKLILEPETTTTTSTATATTNPTDPNSSTSGDGSSDSSDNTPIYASIGGIGGLVLIIAGILCACCIIICFGLCCLGIIMLVVIAVIIVIVVIITIILSVIFGIFKIKGARSKEVSIKDLILEQKIGSGSFGCVYRGKWKNNTIAVKEVKIDQSSYEDFKRELDLSMSLPNHENLVNINAWCSNTSSFYMIMQYYPDGSLEGMLRGKNKKHLTLLQKTKYLIDIANAVCILHDNGIIHRDLAIRNVLVNGDTAAVCDFGLSRLFDVEDDEDVTTTKSNIAPVRNSAVETLLRNEYSKMSDIYMEGIVIWETLSGRLPYEQYAPGEVLTKVCAEDLRPRMDLVPSAFAPLINRCLLKEPTMRSTATEVKQQLEDLHDKLSSNENMSEATEEEGDVRFNEVPVEYTSSDNTPRDTMRSSGSTNTSDMRISLHQSSSTNATPDYVGAQHQGESHANYIGAINVSERPLSVVYTGVNDDQV